MKPALLALCLLVFSVHAFSQSSGLRLDIKDLGNSKPVSNTPLLVVLNADTLSVVTDSSGEVILNHTIGDSVVIEIISTEYRPYKHIFKAPFNQPVIVLLRSKFYEAQEVLVLGNSSTQPAKNAYQMAGITNITMKDMNRLPALNNDPARMAAVLPSVSPGPNNERNEIMVRGNTPTANSWHVDELEVPSPNHFSYNGSTGGVVSMLSGNLLDNFDFSFGSYAAEYGNAFGGIFDLRVRNGNLQEYRNLFEISLLGLDLFSEGPIQKGSSSYIVNGRYSSFGLLDKLGIHFAGILKPEYYDFSFKLFFTSKNRKNTVSLLGMLGYSSIIYEDYSVDSMQKQYLSETEKNKYGMALSTVRFNHYFNNKLSFTTVNGVTGSYFDFLDQGTVSGITLLKEHDTQIFLKSHSYFSYQHNAAFQLKAGLLFTGDFFNLNDAYYAPVSQRTQQVVLAKGFGYYLQQYLSMKYTLPQYWLFSFGYYSIYHATSNKFSIEPRFSVSKQIHIKHRLTFATGLFSKMHDIQTYYSVPDSTHGAYPNMHLPFMKSVQNDLAYIYRHSDKLSFMVEAFYQYMFNIPVNSDSADSYSFINSRYGYVNTNVKATGINYSYGMEVSLNHDFKQGFFYKVNATVYDSRYKGSDGVLHSTAFNSNYSGNIIAGQVFELGARKEHQLLLVVRWAYSGGTRYTPILENASNIAGYTVYDQAHAFEDHGDFYYRFDGSFSYKYVGKKFAFRAKFDIENFTHHQIVINTNYSPTGGLTYDRRGDIIPYISLRVEF